MVKSRKIVRDQEVVEERGSTVRRKQLQQFLGGPEGAPRHTGKACID